MLLSDFIVSRQCDSSNLEEENIFMNQSGELFFLGLNNKRLYDAHGAFEIASLLERDRDLYIHEVVIDQSHIPPDELVLYY